MDVKGLVALWRETLLAQKVLQGETKGYKNHPQLIRFKLSTNPLGAISYYLKEVWQEAEKRGYSFNYSKINDNSYEDTLEVTDGQIGYEFNHLLNKFKNRAPDRYELLKTTEEIKSHPLFRIVKGDIEEWERE